MIALTGLLRIIPAESFWGRFQPNIDLGPHQAIFFLTERDHTLRRVEVSGADEKAVMAEPHCHGLIVSRDFGLRLTTPCRFEGGLAGDEFVAADIEVYRPDSFQDRHEPCRHELFGGEVLDRLE